MTKKIKNQKLCPICGSVMKEIQCPDFSHIHLCTNHPSCPNSKYHKGLKTV